MTKGAAPFTDPAPGEISGAGAQAGSGDRVNISDARAIRALAHAVRLKVIEDELLKLQREYNDYEEIWKAEKASVQGAAHIKEELERIIETLVLQRVLSSDVPRLPLESGMRPQ